ncbi:MAG TPA: CHRD domain-containing protein [Ktedonosporobacter sp.]|nr:CHRD domain-containing protein [Ktedonosporobacter sp.]
MPTRFFFKGTAVPAAIGVLVMSLVLAGCDSPSTSSSAATATSTSGTVVRANVTLNHTPSGAADLSWDPTTHALTVKLALTGLTPGSTHPAHIHAGTCKNAGKALYTLEDVVADAKGAASSITKIPNVTSGIPANGWYVNVHNGPNMTPDTQALPISCADVTNPGSSEQKAQNVQLSLADSTAAGEAARGSALLVLSGNQLTVTVSMQGLVPNTAHAAHISNGACASEGRVLYLLYPVKANAAGEGSSTSVFPNVTAIPNTGWYVDVRMGVETNSQTANAPIACGDVSVAS